MLSFSYLVNFCGLAVSRVKMISSYRAPCVCGYILHRVASFMLWLVEQLDEKPVQEVVINTVYSLICYALSLIIELKLWCSDAHLLWFFIMFNLIYKRVIYMALVTICTWLGKNVQYRVVFMQLLCMAVWVLCIINLCNVVICTIICHYTDNNHRSEHGTMLIYCLHLYSRRTRLVVNFKKI